MHRDEQIYILSCVCGCQCCWPFHTQWSRHTSHHITSHHIMWWTNHENNRVSILCIVFPKAKSLSLLYRPHYLCVDPRFALLMWSAFSMTASTPKLVLPWHVMMVLYPSCTRDWLSVHSHWKTYATTVLIVLRGSLPLTVETHQMQWKPFLFAYIFWWISFHNESGQSR